MRGVRARWCDGCRRRALAGRHRPVGDDPTTTRLAGESGWSRDRDDRSRARASRRAGRGRVDRLARRLQPAMGAGTGRSKPHSSQNASHWDRGAPSQRSSSGRSGGSSAVIGGPQPGGSVQGASSMWSRSDAASVIARPPLTPGTSRSTRGPAHPRDGGHSGQDRGGAWHPHPGMQVAVGGVADDGEVVGDGQRWDAPLRAHAGVVVGPGRAADPRGRSARRGRTAPCPCPACRSRSARRVGPRRTGSRRRRWHRRPPFDHRPERDAERLDGRLGDRELVQQVTRHPDRRLVSREEVVAERLDHPVRGTADVGAPCSRSRNRSWSTSPETPDRTTPSRPMTGDVARSGHGRVRRSRRPVELHAVGQRIRVCIRLDAGVPHRLLGPRASSLQVHRGTCIGEDRRAKPSRAASRTIAWTRSSRWQVHHRDPLDALFPEQAVESVSISSPVVGWHRSG